MNTLPEQNRILFIHGLGGSSQGVKSTFLREIFPEIIIPDFVGTLDERMDQLDKILGTGKDWKIIGSSLGGLMATLAAKSTPERIDRMVLLAPALTWPGFTEDLPGKLETPAIVYLGKYDNLMPINDLLPIVKNVFSNMVLHVVDDDHGLRETIHHIDWKDELGV